MISNTIQKNYQKGHLIVIAAPSGTGKTTLVAALLNMMPTLKRSISHTTRAIRPGETDGVDYYFVNNQEFNKLLTEQVFLEHARVYDYLYGTSKLWIESELNKGSDIILEIDWQGARQIRELFGDQAVLIYLLPPSLSILQERLNNRAQDTQDVINYRLTKAKEDISHYQEFDYLVVNDDLDQAVNQLIAIIKSKKLCLKNQKLYLDNLLKQLLD